MEAVSVVLIVLLVAFVIIGAFVVGHTVLNWPPYPAVSADPDAYAKALENYKTVTTIAKDRSVGVFTGVFDPFLPIATLAIGFLIGKKAA